MHTEDSLLFVFAVVALVCPLHYCCFPYGTLLQVFFYWKLSKRGLITLLSGDGLRVDRLENWNSTFVSTSKMASEITGSKSLTKLSSGPTSSSKNFSIFASHSILSIGT